MLYWLKRLLYPKDLTLSVSKAQKELLDLLMINKTSFDDWVSGQSAAKVRFHFFYPTAIDFYYDEFKLFTAFFRKSKKDEIELLELKMTETNYDSIRCQSWAPFEEVMIDFLTSLEENKKIALFEKRKTLLEYQALCTRNAGASNPIEEYTTAIPIQKLKPTQ